MNTKTIGWFLGIVVVLGAVWYLVSGSANKSANVSPVATTTQEGATTGPKGVTTKSPSTSPTATKAKVVGVGPIPQIIGLKQPLVCTVSTTANATIKRSGTLYVAGTKVRANFVGSTMIDDGTYLYGWANGATKGLQLLVSSSASGSAIARNGGIDLVTDLSYACNPWPVDMGIFAPPTSVSFYSSL